MRTSLIPYTLIGFFSCPSDGVPWLSSVSVSVRLTSGSQNESQSRDWGSERKGELSIVDQSDNFLLRSSWFWTLLVMNWFWIQKWQNSREIPSLLQWLLQRRLLVSIISIVWPGWNICVEIFGKYILLCVTFCMIFNGMFDESRNGERGLSAEWAFYTYLHNSWKKIVSVITKRIRQQRKRSFYVVDYSF